MKFLAVIFRTFVEIYYRYGQFIELSVRIPHGCQEESRIDRRDQHYRRDHHYEKRVVYESFPFLSYHLFSPLFFLIDPILLLSKIGNNRQKSPCV